jgi:hypothetical protein
MLRESFDRNWLVGLGVRQHARADSLSKRAPSTLGSESDHSVVVFETDIIDLGCGSSRLRFGLFCNSFIDRALGDWLLR